jgi:hypothetical protein
VAIVRNPGRKAMPVVVDLVVHFVKMRGDAKPKVFKLRSLTLEPGGEARLSKSLSLAQHTTRTHHPGRHRVDVLLNSSAVPGVVHAAPGRPVPLASAFAGALRGMPRLAGLPGPDAASLVEVDAEDVVLERRVTRTV